MRQRKTLYFLFFAISHRNHRQISRNWKHVVASINQLFATRTHKQPFWDSMGTQFAVGFSFHDQKHHLRISPILIFLLHSKFHRKQISSQNTKQKNRFQLCATTLKALTKKRKKAGAPSEEGQARPGLSSSDKACPKMELNVKILRGLFI